MSDSASDQKDSVTEVAEESFVRDRPLEIERGAVLAGRYQVEEVIGKGGSGVVLRVFDRTVQNVVALKVLKSELARDAKWDKRFSRELRLGRPIQHPNVCRVFDIGEADGHRFLTMELATGGSLRDELKRRPALERPIEERLRDARAAVEGLAAIHGSGVVHRDFKPDNLLRMEDGRLVISDFGLATDAATAPGVTVMIGTPHYMAPEVLAGEPATSRSDVWALGVVLHEITFGRRPERKNVSFEGKDHKSSPPLSNVERAIQRVCEHCCADLPGDRPADAAAVARELEAALATDRAPRRSKRLGVLAVASVAMLAAGVFVFRKAVHSVRARPRPAAPDLLQPRGTPADWTTSARVVATFAGAVHCLSTIDAHTVRVVWGGPRRAQDVDVDSGRAADALLLPETFKIACPQWSPGAHGLLFVAKSAAGANEIRLSKSPDGTGATVLTSGTDPVWLGHQPAFLYVVDGVHTAVFSLATMQFTLLPERDPSGQVGVGDESIDTTGRRAALVLYDARANAELAVMDLTTLRPLASWPIPQVSRIAFDARGSLLLAARFSQDTSSVAACDPTRFDCVYLGRVPGLELSQLSPLGDRLAVVGRRVKSQAVIDEDGSFKPVSPDEDVVAVSQSTTGELLLSRKDEAGRGNVWLRKLDGTETRLTNGTMDFTPAFAPDGRRWVYADYVQKAIMICPSVNDRCRVLVKDDGLPVFPVFAPDGGSIAYVTQLGRTQVRVVDATTGEEHRAWDGVWICAPIWSGNKTVWTVETNGGRHYWTEHDLSTGGKIGPPLPFENEDGDDFLWTNCQPAGVERASPLFRRLRIRREEESRVLLTPAEPIVR